jgi:tripartite-type tricarboxylate transporter receptor subunit TctC
MGHDGEVDGILAAWLLAVVAAPAVAQNPSRPIRLIVPIPAGGAPDIVARVVGQKLSELLEQPVVVENHAGSNGNIAGDIVAKAPPDGHTLLLGQDSLVAINPHLYAKMPFDPLKDLAPVATVQRISSSLRSIRRCRSRAFRSSSNTLAARRRRCLRVRRQRQPASSVDGDPEAARRHRSPARAFQGRSAGDDATVAGDTVAMFAGTSTKPQIRAGKLRALAATGRERSPEFPDLPAIGEIYPGYEVTIWLGIFAPAGTPDAGARPPAHRAEPRPRVGGRQGQAQCGGRGRALGDDPR